LTKIFFDDMAMNDQLRR